ncbi:MAG: Thiamine-monophosphate kinase [Syntrophaceae bacterium PtaU1.Bin231]|nr:MAG: Thiamine-monophosphate kinase [Syntrophaceae bacterium PtaU1.Bin231]
MKISDLGEFGLIDRIRGMLPDQTPDVIVGIGDDVAVLRGNGDTVWLVTCDVQVEGSHFLLGAVSPRDLGHKALAINLSDIAGTGGSPRFALISLGLPKDLPVGFIDALYTGLRAEAEASGTAIVGGNISGSKLGFFIDIFLMGEAPEQEVLLRSGARPGDKILVTGSLGDAAAAVAMHLDPTLGTRDDYRRLAFQRFNRPTPRLKEGRLIAKTRNAAAMLDISDGLAGDLDHLCERSGVGARVHADRLPVLPENRILSQEKHGNEWHFSIFGGEDYELLFTAPLDTAETLARTIAAETGTPVSIIGEILPLSEGRQLVLPDGRVVPLEQKAWDHLRS